MNKDTSNSQYTNRLEDLSGKKWKETLDVQRPYRWNLKRLSPGKTLDVGCGIGRYLKSLPKGSVGVDHNKHSVEKCQKMGLVALTSDDFFSSNEFKNTKFDSMLLGHVLEHMTPKQGLAILKEYAPFIKRGGKIIIMCPQEKGYPTDSTHVTFHTHSSLEELLKEAGFKVKRSYSFPFPKPIGKIFKYNETIVIATV